MWFDISARCACVAAFNLYCVRAVNENIKEIGYWQHLQINDFRFGIEVRITSRTEVSDSDAEYVVMHHRFSSVQYVGAQECDRQHENRP